MRIALIVSALLLLTGHSYASSTQVLDDKGATSRRMQYSVSNVAYVPFHGTLRERKVPFSVVNAQARYAGSRAPLLNEVIRLVPHYFPPQGRVLSVRQTGSAKHQYFLVSFNKAFSNPKFWQSRKHYECRLAFHALARNVAFQNEPKGIPLPVRFVIDGKPVSRIGSFPTSQSLEPQKIIKPRK